MPVPFWDDDPTAWDRLYIGGLLAPGFVRDIDVVRGRKVQKNAGPGIDGANLVAQGRNLAEVPITLEIVGRESLKRAEAFIRDRLPKAKDEGAVTFAHPLLTMHGLAALSIEEFDGPKRQSEGVYHMTIKACEYRPPSKTNRSGRSPRRCTSPDMPSLLGVSARSERNGEGDRAAAERADRRSDRPRRAEAAAGADVPDADAAERGSAAGAGREEVSPQWRISLRPLPGARERTSSTAKLGRSRSAR